MATAKITNETMVECKNGTHGNLFYASTRNPGYTVEWTEFGEVQEWKCWQRNRIRRMLP